MDEKRKVQEALNRSLSGLKGNPYLAQRVIQNAKGENKHMKKKLSSAVILAVVLALAMMGTAYALGTSFVAEFFGKHWSPELGPWLQEGKVAQTGESTTLGDVSLTLDEVVYRGGGLYGVGTIRAKVEKDVLFPEEDLNWMSEEEEKEGYNWFEINPSAAALVQKAQTTGGRLLTVRCMPERIGVDGGEMLTPGCVGYYDLLNEDGSLTFSFEVEDNWAIEEGTTYQIEMEILVCRVDENGRDVNDSVVKGSWTVSFEPVFLTETTEQPDVQVDLSTIQTEGYELLVPAEYRETGTLPVYQAFAADFTSVVKPEWFNQTGIAKQVAWDYFIFDDHAEMFLDPESFGYQEFEDGEGNERASAKIVELVWMNSWEAYRGQFTLDKTELNAITLAEAQTQAEDLMDQLGLKGYLCDYALDMSKERISEMGALYNQAIETGYLMTDDSPYDYDSIPASEEGYYLSYSPLGVDGANEGRYKVILYINGRGIVYANVRNDFLRGDALYTPEALISPDKAVEQLCQEAARTRCATTVVSIQRVALTYTAVRADNKAEGMAFIPVWQVRYQDESGVKQGYHSNAEFSALDGKLVNAPF